MATWYQTGTIAVTNGSATITGTTTAWVANAQVGDALIGPDGKFYEVGAIVSDSQVTLVTPYLGATASAQAYRIVPTMGWTIDTMNMLRDFQTSVDDMLDGPGQGKFAGEVVFTGDEDSGMRRLASNHVALFTGDTDQLAVTGGVASGAAVQSDTTDATTGKLLKAGAGGLLAATGPSVADLDALANTLFFRESGATGSPSSGNAVVGMHLAGASANRAIQIAARPAADKFWWRRKNTTWGDWREFVTLDSNGDMNIDGATLFVEASTNRVGFGTNNPQAPAHVNGPSGNILRLATDNNLTDAEVAIEFRHDEDGNDFDAGRVVSRREGATNDFSLIFEAGRSGVHTETMRVSGKDSTPGWVGIATSSPDYHLHINGKLGFAPGPSATPVNNGDVVIEATSNTSLTLKLKGSDGTVRSTTLTLT